MVIMCQKAAGKPSRLDHEVFKHKTSWEWYFHAHCYCLRKK